LPVVIARGEADFPAEELGEMAGIGVAETDQFNFPKHTNEERTDLLLVG
jgi:hypothetical protein